MNVITATYNSTYPDEQEISLVKSAGELFAEVIPKTALPPKKENERADLLHELYLMYAKAQDDKNRINYYRYIRVHHPTALSKEEEYYKYKDQYRKAKLPETVKYSPLIKEYIFNAKGKKVWNYQWYKRFTHLQGEEGNASLRHMLSVAKSMIHRKQSVIPYILGATKAVEKST